MKEKIEWYREVLELEPNSKVFFPLARLLVQCGQLDDALTTLEHGIERHPEYIEARLCYIELLYKNGRMPQCRREVERLSGLFSGYSGFWEAWGACLAASGKGRDVSLAMTFLSAFFQNSQLTLAQVMELGLQAVMQHTAPPAASAQPVPSATPTPEKTPPPQERPAASLAAPVFHQEPVAAGYDDAPDEHVSLRTRSMADVLAGQGDVRGALEIYQELAATAATPEETRELQQRIAALNARLGAQTDATPQKEPAPEASAPAESAPGKDNLLSLLENLADRLEIRAQG